jgi:hypothetical protein
MPYHPIVIRPRIAAIVATLGCATAFAAEPNIHDGQWSYEATVRMDGQSFAIPPMNYKSCLSKSSPIPTTEPPGQQNKKANECKVLKQDVSGNRLTWHAKARTAPQIQPARQATKARA